MMTKTLLDFYGPLFEVEHPEGCSCPQPNIPLIIDLGNDCYRVSDKCSICGLAIHAKISPRG